jgi:isoleucyl-tRNA synthetase
MKLMRIMNQQQKQHAISEFVQENLSNWYVRLCEVVFGKASMHKIKGLLIRLYIPVY